MNKEIRIIITLSLFLAPLMIQAQMTTKVIASASISNKIQTFNGSERPVAVTTIPSNLTTDITYNGSSVLPVNAGKYVVVATINDPTYQGSVTDTLVITKARVKINVSNLSQIYDGMEKPVNITSNPSGLNIKVTYNGSSTVPSEIGTYQVDASVIDNNFQGNTQTALTIRKASPEIMVSGLTKIFNGTPQGINIETMPEGLPYIVTYNGSTSEPVNAGIYSISININNEHYKGSANTYLIIEKAQAEMHISGMETTYDGSNKSIRVTTVPSDLNVNITYNGSSTTPVKAGLYKVIAEVKDPNYKGSMNDTLTISKAFATIKVSNLETKYNGKGNPVNVEITPSGISYKLTYDDITRAPVYAGIYKINLVVVDENYQGSVSDTLVIAKVDTNISLRCSNVTYDGLPHRAEVLNVPAGMKYSLRYNGSENLPVNAGMYIVEASIQNKNFAGTAIDTIIIYKKLAQIYVSNLVTVYDGNEKQPIIKTSPSNLSIDLAYNSTSSKPINAGVYILKASINNLNYFGAIIDTLVINKAQQAITWNQDLSGKVIGETIELNAVSSSWLDVYYTSSNPSVAYVFGSELIIRGNGQATITVHQDGDNNISKAATVSQVIVVTQNNTKSVTSLEETGTITSVKCWPNPATDYLTMGIDAMQGVDINIYNQAGMLMEKQIITGLNPTLDISGLVPGLYFIEMNYNNKSYTLKVSKQ